MLEISELEAPVMVLAELPELPVVEVTEETSTSSDWAVVVLRKPRETARRGESFLRKRGDTILRCTWYWCLRCIDPREYRCWIEL